MLNPTGNPGKMVQNTCLGIIQVKGQGGWGIFIPHLSVIGHRLPPGNWACDTHEQSGFWRCENALHQRCRCWPWKVELEWVEIIRGPEGIGTQNWSCLLQVSEVQKLALQGHMTRGVKLIFTRGHISLTVAFKGPNVILGLYKCNYSLTVKQELSTATK